MRKKKKIEGANLIIFRSSIVFLQKINSIYFDVVKGIERVMLEQGVGAVRDLVGKVSVP